ncbi:hypothetical protein [Massilia yuzhufengensis]|uniref:Uncharacterized protein n=1 Tax=Massilia yuzhufengensis TaxID=1164594 RepID=A0A1I1UBG9_9BURK|nr:hypothetical protein [Massilia yuzhufengensis]SFD66113.1 hypothetical protein SAMN05216204_13211 [Massilia yuzhufengensis]
MAHHQHTTLSDDLDKMLASTASRRQSLRSLFAGAAAFPLATLTEAYASSGYGTSVSKLARISYATDNVFSDGVALQMASVTGNATQGYVATLTVGVSL